MRALTLFVILALPLAASPSYRLYDCKGIESQCQGLFPGQPAQYEDNSKFIIGDRLIVNGFDLGPAGGLHSAPGDILHQIIYVRAPWVIGWEYECCGDDDGSVVKWLLDATGATFLPTPITGPEPSLIDVNSFGQVIGSGHGGSDAYFDSQGQPTEYLRSIQIDKKWQGKLVDIGTSELFRINDAGQILGVTGFWNLKAGEFDPPSEERLFVLSPSAVSIPEPGTALLAIGGLAVAWKWRRHKSCHLKALTTGRAA